MNVKGEVSRSWCGDLTERDRRNQRLYLIWAFVWMSSFTLATLLLAYQPWPLGAFRYVVALIPTGLGVGAMFAFVRFLREADELQRQIQMEALAWGFGCGAVFMIGYRLLERAGFPAIDTSDPLLLMVVAWALAVILLSRRYS